YRQLRTLPIGQLQRLVCAVRNHARGQHHQVGRQFDGVAQQRLLDPDRQLPGRILFHAPDYALGEEVERMLLDLAVIALVLSGRTHVLIDDVDQRIRIVCAELLYLPQRPHAADGRTIRQVIFVARPGALDEYDAPRCDGPARQHLFQVDVSDYVRALAVA